MLNTALSRPTMGVTTIPSLITRKLQNNTKGEICEFSVFPFSLQLMFDQTLNNLCLSLSDDLKKLHTKVAQPS